MKITVSSSSSKINKNKIPHIIHGISANTMFYLINYENLFKDKEFNLEENATTMNTPYDNDDFGRIMNAYYAFEWKIADIERAKNTAIKLQVARKIIAFLDEFLSLVKIYLAGDMDDLDVALDNINYNPEYQKDSGEFSIDTSIL